MTFKQILVPVTGGERDDVALGTAFTIAAQSNAHIVALFVRPDTKLSTPLIGFTLFPDVIAEISKSAKEVAHEASRIVRRRFTMAAIEAQVTILERPKQSSAVTASFQEAEGFVFECVSEAAKFADLVVYGPLGEPEDFQTSAGFADVLLTARRPVLVSPRKLNHSPRRIAIGWDGGHATARAICAALPLLTVANEIDVITVKHPSFQDHAFDALRDYLAASGVHASSRIIERDGRSIGEALMEAARSSSAELLVIGGYGHSPLREAILGGTTAFAVAETTLPIFLVH